VRHASVAAEVARQARGADVVYATSMVRRAAAGAALARRPLVVKLVADEAFERARRAGRFAGSLEEFQRVPGGARLRALRRTRDRALRRAAHVFCPSAYLRQIALGWGLDPGRVSVLPNPAPPLPALPSRDELRGALGLDGPTLAFAGRLTSQKALDVALAALAEVPGVAFVVLGDGPDRRTLERRAAELQLDGRVRFLGGGTRDDVLRLFRAADASLLPSAWENFPHTVVEALAVGTPVIATAVGGVAEVVRDGENGLLVPPRDVDALAAAISRFVHEDGLREKLAAAAAPSVEALAEPRLLARVEAELVRAAAA
jgi:glycosyltransferase involved in cell wall biosynthesis